MWSTGADLVDDRRSYVMSITTGITVQPSAQSQTQHGMLLAFLQRLPRSSCSLSFDVETCKLQTMSRHWFGYVSSTDLCRDKVAMTWNADGSNALTSIMQGGRMRLETILCCAWCMIISGRDLRVDNFTASSLPAADERATQLLVEGEGCVLDQHDPALEHCRQPDRGSIDPCDGIRMNPQSLFGMWLQTSLPGPTSSHSHS